MIICVLGRGASGKDTLMDFLMQIHDLEKLPLFTTRPKRPTEDEDSYIWAYEFNDGIYAEVQNKIIRVHDNCAEIRKYNSAHGEWYYGTLIPTVTTIFRLPINLYNIKKKKLYSSNCSSTVKELCGFIWSR